MIKRTQRLQQQLTPASRAFSARVAAPDGSTVFPNEYEGNIYDVNWSLCEDGVVPVGNAYRNARISLLTNALGAKKSAPVTTTKPLYFGKYSLTEAGDTVSQDEFSDLFEAQKELLSSGTDLFVEDASLGSYTKTRVGVRVITNDPATALIARTLLVPTI